MEYTPHIVIHLEFPDPSMLPRLDQSLPAPLSVTWFDSLHHVVRKSFDLRACEVRSRQLSERRCIQLFSAVFGHPKSTSTTSVFVL
ncbi:hypothetical protein PoB_004678900 [Plakobranchus ocellatus]|uniref:Uncharacterized protein n=1 Tax=Plakobranchus ocellatus TaxID=259542 RepID=A0AAV4BJH5_9GAST|nr:hypothetical protein PoB_004678900 [Plakobranchus ocellatus]